MRVDSAKESRPHAAGDGRDGRDACSRSSAGLLRWRKKVALVRQFLGNGILDRKFRLEIVAQVCNDELEALSEAGHLVGTK